MNFVTTLYGIVCGQVASQKVLPGQKESSLSDKVCLVKPYHSNVAVGMSSMMLCI